MDKEDDFLAQVFVQLHDLGKQFLALKQEMRLAERLLYLAGTDENRYAKANEALLRLDQASDSIKAAAYSLSGFAQGPAWNYYVDNFVVQGYLVRGRGYDGQAASDGANDDNV